MKRSLLRWCLLGLGLAAALVAGSARAHDDDDDHGGPKAAIADLSLTMIRNGELQVGSNTGYSLVVRNGGPSAAGGPVVVVDVLPAGVSLVSAGGPGWSCFAFGRILVCSSAGPLAVGAVLPTLAVTISANQAGTYTNMATVGGPTPDNVWPNNTASDSGSALAVGATSYVFTAVECKSGDLVGDSGTPCPQFVGPVTAGSATPANIYVTTVTVDGRGRLVASPYNLIGPTSLLLRFSLECDDPAKRNVSAVYSLVPAPLALKCSADGAPTWSNHLALTLPTDKVSLPASFVWEDVGNVTLNLIDSKGKTASTSFVVKPDRLQFKYVLRTVDGAPLPAETAATGFVRAGEAFTLAVGAKTSSDRTNTGSNWAPGFGSELGATLGSLIKLVLNDGTALPGNAPPDLTPGDGSAFAPTGDGFVVGTRFAWNRLGVLALKPVLNDYLGAGQVNGVGTSIGRFYPDHFETTAGKVFACVKNLPCTGVAGAAYSGQKFPVTVTAFGVSVPVQGFAGTITLEAYDRPGGDTKNPGGVLLGQPLQPGEVVAEADKPIQANPSYNLANPFNSSDPRANKWTRPTPIYLRASIKLDVVKDNKGNIEKDHPVTSKDRAVEGGIMVVHGRLQLANTYGSELLKLPVRMNAQYWTGTAWDNNSADSISTIGAGKILFTVCTNALLKDGNCNLRLLKAAAEPGALKDGAGTIWLAAPGRGNTGSTWLQVVDLDNLPWLPSTRARAVYGIYKSPLIYIREVY